ncbi:MAG: hypothetical protein QXW79_01655 [Thermoplasmata archaeon]
MANTTAIILIILGLVILGVATGLIIYFVKKRREQQTPLSPLISPPAISPPKSRP